VTETFSAAKNWTAEPTVVTVLHRAIATRTSSPTSATTRLRESPDFAAAKVFVFRVTNPPGNQSVNVRAWTRWARV
jgi:hypothetical protein